MLISGWESEKPETHIACISKRLKLLCLEYVFQFCLRVVLTWHYFHGGFYGVGFFLVSLVGWFSLVLFIKE